MSTIIIIAWSLFSLIWIYAAVRLIMHAIKKTKK